MPGVAVPGAAAGGDTGGLGRQPEDAPEARIERGEDPSAENDENAPPGAVGEKRGWVLEERTGNGRGKVKGGYIAPARRQLCTGVQEWCWANVS